ncbi:hypothetical protein F441_13410 [Phytophthora nicotianae CJ01A1]|uniref:Uncharacterized protein n=2 Tax=Phytophthora nicotianae TaxID=4792 RepID=W2R502_PHYN3|nr:hypothetical protein PPTG_21306 [Phytophthora nicotianae INRA-310]ETN20458.1 hypothetical protein PPTG_21306 [Phytophthora nicotianae INRA-310]ETP11059.1 hypothetical protein F441_13410 [Phytophthora nicotianae CJ01A1]
MSLVVDRSRFFLLARFRLEPLCRSELFVLDSGALLSDEESERTELTEPLIETASSDDGDDGGDLDGSEDALLALYCCLCDHSVQVEPTFSMILEHEEIPCLSS